MTKFDFAQWIADSPIKLTRGEGDPETGGCWMAALSIYSNDSWSDHPACVHIDLVRIAQAINDAISSDGARGRIIGPHILEPVGTNSGHAANETAGSDALGKNAAKVAHAASQFVRQFAPTLAANRHTWRLINLKLEEAGNLADRSAPLRWVYTMAAILAANGWIPRETDRLIETVILPAFVEVCQAYREEIPEPACEIEDIAPALQC